MEPFGPHTLTGNVPQDTPVNHDAFKVADSNRLPETYVQRTAEEKRDNMRQDARDTTILMRLAQFRTDVLGGQPADFEVDDAEVQKVWTMFRTALGLPEKTELKGAEKAKATLEPAPPEPKLTEKRYSEAWVRVSSVAY